MFAYLIICDKIEEKKLPKGPKFSVYYAKRGLETRGNRDFQALDLGFPGYFSRFGVFPNYYFLWPKIKRETRFKVLILKEYRKYNLKNTFFPYRAIVVYTEHIVQFRAVLLMHNAHCTC